MEGARARVGVIGGSGLYRLASAMSTLAVSTPYGDASDSIDVCRIGAVDVAFLARHGRGHTIPPHRINHRANLWALHSLGVTRLIAPSAVGSLRVGIAPGDVVICDQFIDHTGGRHHTTFFDGPEVAHATMADPYCAELRPLAAEACRGAGFTVHDSGTVTVVSGPRFATRAESRRFRAEGGEVINMTQFPEVALARELGLCYVNLALVTDYDVGVEDRPEHAAVTQDAVIARLAEHSAALHRALVQLASRAGAPPGCSCAAMRAVPLAH
ncbi:MAG: MTAP family purine nucleoside phosphorylase [Candidatus Dormibacteria bacterium]